MTIKQTSTKSTLVIKVGGAFMQSDAHALALLNTIQQLQQDYHLVLVHGGGAMVEELMQALQLKSEKIDGLRVTPNEHMPYITGALAGTANKQLSSLAIQAGLTPVGLSLADGKMCLAKVMREELGAVGTVEAGDPSLLKLLAQTDILPIISSIGASESGQLLNVNADQAATVIAQLLDAELLLLSDVPGVLDGNKSLINELTSEQISTLVEDNVIRDGMIVKVEAALTAANSLGRNVTIASWKDSEKLLGLLQQQAVGTKIFPAVNS
ncbi:acetylglutamate kinase [Paraglaciecola aquimarina]|uniref:Acetylglutamate kinase n=1 Tax=Paraglaciecola algarum TaxID=3050085 RepID=A0ABS9D8N3_9ALTE|nr:acetylglutamate kinase [Paraglaciecola sp. G1-23]MCF2949332.1 acetylglutamate kinase [Paraglaciecola sp. G1-23]